MSYGGYTQFAEEMEAVLGEGFLILYAVQVMISLLFGLTFYILQSVGYYTIAKRRQINHAWMAWVPVLNSYILGCISDQFQYVARGRNKSKRKTLLTLNIIVAVLCFAIIASSVFFVVGLVQSGDMDALMPMQAVVWALVIGLLSMILGGVAIADVVVRYIALYDLYTSCEPDNNVLFLVLGIFFSITEPIFIMVCRKKDKGMPPRRAANPPLLDGSM